LRVFSNPTKLSANLASKPLAAVRDVKVSVLYVLVARSSYRF